MTQKSTSPLACQERIIFSPHFCIFNTIWKTPYKIFNVFWAGQYSEWETLQKKPYDWGLYQLVFREWEKYAYYENSGQSLNEQRVSTYHLKHVDAHKWPQSSFAPHILWQNLWSCTFLSWRVDLSKLLLELIVQLWSSQNKSTKRFLYKLGLNTPVNRFS